MRYTYWAILATSLLAGGMAALSGCDSARPGAGPAASTTAAPTRSHAGAAPDASAPGTTDSAPAPEDRDKRYRQAILREVINNPKIGQLIPHKPVLGGTWRIGEAEDVHFLGSGRIALDYEDGHVAGRLVVHVVNPHDLTTWKVLRDEPA
jgi:hypothetical protein